MHKKLQVSRLSLLLTSPDPCVRLMAENSSWKGITTSRPKFKASREVREVMIQNPDFTRKSLNKAAKLLVSEGDEDQHLTYLQCPEKQGHMSRCSSPDGMKFWAKAIEGLKDEHQKFVLNSAVNTLSHNANLHMWKKRKDLCGKRQTLIHVLNTCKAARDARRYNVRHDTVLNEIVSLVSAYTKPPATLSADLGDYNFPHHIVPTDLRPDIVWWDDSRRRILLVELTICFKSSFQHAAERKELKFEDVMYRAISAGYSGCVITLQVGSRGIIDPAGFSLLQKEINIHKRDHSRLFTRISSLVIQESFKIWCQRNRQPLP